MNARLSLRVRVATIACASNAGENLDEFSQYGIVYLKYFYIFLLRKPPFIPLCGGFFNNNTCFYI